MIRRDWLLQQLEAIAEAIARSVGRRKETPDQQAAELLATTSRRLLGIDLDTLARFGADQAAALLGSPERCAVAAALLAEDADAGGDPVRAALGAALLRHSLREAPELSGPVVDSLAARLAGLVGEA